MILVIKRNFSNLTMAGSLSVFFVFVFVFFSMICAIGRGSLFGKLVACNYIIGNESPKVCFKSFVT